VRIEHDSPELLSKDREELPAKKNFIVVYFRP
jgi:hypothetical protein